MTNEKALQYLKNSMVKQDGSFPQACERMRRKLSPRSQDLIRILESLITINPYLRATAAECLKLELFDPIRNSVKEQVLAEMYKRPPIALAIDAADAFDYHDLARAKYSLQDIKKMIASEVKAFNERRRAWPRGAL